MSEIDLRAVIDELLPYIDLDDLSYGTSIHVRDLFDLVETIAERKPIYVPRGLQPPWRDLLMGNYDEYGLEYGEGPIWDANPTTDWPAEMVQRLRDRPWADFFSRSEKALSLASSGNVTLQQEADLLGYPICCVQGYYDRHRAYAAYIKEAYLSASRGDPEAITELIDQNTAIPIDPLAASVYWRNGDLSPMCSFAYCDRCLVGSTAPGPLANQRRAEFFREFAPTSLLRDMERMAEQAMQETQDILAAYDHRVSWEHVNRLFIRG